MEACSPCVLEQLVSLEEGLVWEAPASQVGAEYLAVCVGGILVLLVQTAFGCDILQRSALVEDVIELEQLAVVEMLELVLYKDRYKLHGVNTAELRGLVQLAAQLSELALELVWELVVKIERWSERLKIHNKVD